MNEDTSHIRDRTRVVADGASGRLTTPAGEGWPVRLAERDGDVLLLVLMLEDDDKEFGEYDIDPLVLELTSVYGLARFRGEAALEERDLLRFSVVEDPEVLQRRRHVRLRAEQQVEFLLPGTGIPMRDGRAIEISGGGMLMNGVGKLALGDRIKFQLHLEPAAPPIKGVGRVVRSGGREQRAVVFERIAKRDRERLIHFIFARERHERAMARDKR